MDVKKYKLVNTTTKEETICDKVVVDGFDYYVSDNPITEKWEGFAYKDDVKIKVFKHYFTTNEWYKDSKKVIATNNPNIDIPKVVDETLDYRFDREFFNPLIAPIVNEIKQKDYSLFLSIGGKLYDVLFENYKYQETLSNSDEDLINLIGWYETSQEVYEFWRKNRVHIDMSNNHIVKIKENIRKLVQIWKEQNPKIIYYE